MAPDDFPAPTEGFVVTHTLIVDDIARSRDFYSRVFGAKVLWQGDAGPAILKMANTWVIINTGGGPTADKPTVTLSPPEDPDKIDSFMNVRVADIQAAYQEWTARGAAFLTPPYEWEREIRAYIRDPDGYLIEVGQSR